MEKFIEYPMSELMEIPKSGGIYELIKNHYWVVNDAGNVFFFGKSNQSPQCNTNKHMVERWLSKFENSSALFIENAWVKVNIQDYI